MGHSPIGVALRQHKYLVRLLSVVLSVGLIFALTTGCVLPREETPTLSHPLTVRKPVEETVRLYKSRLTFEAVRSQWSDAEIAQLKPLFEAAYPRVQNLYGPPDMSGIEAAVTVRKITPKDRADFGESELTPAWVSLEASDDEYSDKRHVALFLQPDLKTCELAHELVHVFAGKIGGIVNNQPGGSAWVEGMAGLVETLIGRELGQPSDNDVGTDFLLATFNKPALVSSWVWSDNQTNGALRGIRYMVASYTWQDLNRQDPTFLKEFSARLRKIATSKLEKEGLEPLVALAERIRPGFRAWHDQQWIFSTQEVAGEQVLAGAFYQEDGLHIMIIHFSRDATGKETPIPDQPLHIEVDWQGTVDTFDEQSDQNGQAAFRLVIEDRGAERGEVSRVSVWSDSGVRDELVPE